MKQMVDNVYAELAPLFPGFKLNKNEEGFVRVISRPAVKSSWFRLSIDTLVTLFRFCAACGWTK